MIRAALEEYTWASEAILAAELDGEGTVLRANPALERFAGPGVAGSPFAALVASAQRPAFARAVDAAEDGWRATSFALQVAGSDAASDRQVWLRRAGETILLVAEPAVAQQQQLLDKVLELNDDLVTAHRELVAQREELRAAAAHIRRLEAISAAGLTHLRLDDVLHEVLRLIADAVGAPRAVLLLREPGDVLVGRAAIGIDESVRKQIRVPMGAGVAGRIARENRPRIIRDLSQVEVYSAYLRESSRSMAGVPLALDGEVIGVLHVSSDEPDRFGEEDLAVLEPAAERAALAIGRARTLERERRIAETLQRSLLPERLPSVEGIELAARFTPGAGVDVGGDWYDALPLPGGALAVAIGDVAGKGLSAARVMGELRSGLRAYAIEGGGPMETLARLNRLAERSIHMATVLLVHVEPGAERLTYASAGHLPPLMVGADGRAEFLPGGASTPLLAFRDDVPAGTAGLEPGARVLLYTDGLVERRTEPIDESLERLRVAASAFAGRAGELCDHVMAAMRPPAGTPHDDIAVIAFERRAA